VLPAKKVGRGWSIPANVLEAFITGGWQSGVDSQRAKKKPATKED
jgi:hypothetical protein